MSEFELSTPQLRFIADPLHEFANDHGVPTTDSDIKHAQRYSSETIRHQGHSVADSVDRLIHMGMGWKFEVNKHIPASVPLTLGRLALYERGHASNQDGVWTDGVRWVRLFNIPMNDSRVDEIIGIIGAHRAPDDEVLLHIDETTGRPTPYTLHPIAGDEYAIQVSQVEPHSVRLPVTIIDFTLPTRGGKND